MLNKLPSWEGKICKQRQIFYLCLVQKFVSVLGAEVNKSPIKHTKDEVANKSLWNFLFQICLKKTLLI